MIWLYIALSMTSNIDCYRLRAVPKTESACGALTMRFRIASNLEVAIESFQMHVWI